MQLRNSVRHVSRRAPLVLGMIAVITAILLFVLTASVGLPVKALVLDSTGHTTQRRIQDEPAMRSGQCAWQRRTQLDGHGLAVVDGDKVDILAEPAVLLSAASAWEIAIKYHLGKLSLPQAPASYVPDRMRRTGTSPLPIDHAHTLRTAELPNHHRDPFDRVLVAQAQLLDLTIITADSQLSAYDVAVVAA